MHELVIQAGRVVCPRTGRDGPGAVGIDGDRIAAVGKNLEGEDCLELPNAILLPGLIDLHSHPGRGGTTVHAVSTHKNMFAFGVTTTLSQGDAGADNFADYLENTFEPSGTRVFIQMHLELDGNMTLNLAHKIADEVEAEIKLVFPDAEVMIHQDPAGLVEDHPSFL